MKNNKPPKINQITRWVGESLKPNMQVVKRIEMRYLGRLKGRVKGLNRIGGNSLRHMS
jgi:hypothetical protein